jgi:hypothetical protein
LLAKLGGGAAEELFVHFGEFAGEDDGPVAEDGVDIGKGFDDPVGRFVKDERCRGAGPRFEGLAALSWFGREEAAEDEGVRREAGGAEGGEDGGWAGKGDDGDAFGGGGGDEAKSRVRDERGTSIADERNAFAGAKGVQEFVAAFAFVVFVIADERFGDAVVIEKFSTVAGVLAGDTVNLVFQNTEGPDGDVLQVANGGGDKIECGGH